MVQQHLKRHAKISTSAESHAAIQELRVPFVGFLSEIDPPKMSTQSLFQSKDLTNPNKKEVTESLDSAASCVCGIEKKKQRIGVRLSLAERQALEIEASQNSMTLSHWIRTSLISKNIAA